MIIPLLSVRDWVTPLLKARTPFFTNLSFSFLEMAMPLNHRLLVVLLVKWKTCLLTCVYRARIEERGEDHLELMCQCLFPHRSCSDSPLRLLTLNTQDLGGCLVPPSSGKSLKPNRRKRAYFGRQGTDMCFWGSLPCNT